MSIGNVKLTKEDFVYDSYRDSPFSKDYQRNIQGSCDLDLLDHLGDNRMREIKKAILPKASEAPLTIRDTPIYSGIFNSFKYQDSVPKARSNPIDN